MDSLDDVMDELSRDAIYDSIIEVFSKHHPLKLIPISNNAIPLCVLDCFDYYSRNLLHPIDYAQKKFECFFMLKNNDYRTYITKQTREVESEDAVDGEHLFYLVDADSRGIIARAHLRFNFTDPDVFFSHKPFVESNCVDCDSPFIDIYDTDPDKVLQKIILKQWIDVGTKQIVALNALSHAFFDLPVYSNTLLTETEKLLWNNLLEKHKVKSIMEKELTRYVFLSRSANLFYNRELN